MTRRERIRERLLRPVDGAGPAAFRILFGGVMFVALVRFLTSGWIPTFYGEPGFFFKYWGFHWVPVAPVAVMYALYGALAVLALFIALGLFYRASAALFFLGFAYAELTDVTNYLNHYYLVTLLAGLMVFLPLHRTWSLDARRRPALRSDTVPAWCLYLVRSQIAIVYLFAGLAKLGSDWLLHAQPLGIWLSAHTDMAVIGPVLDDAWFAYAASWAGFLYDTTIVLWLSLRRTRPYAFAAVVGFHTMTHLWFNIGVFPFLMTVSALIFFPPDWPRRLLARLSRRQPATPVLTPRGPTRLTRVQRVGLTAAAAFLAIQVILPLRHIVYPGDVLWNEQGMRWAWKVMVREKHGALTYYVRFPDTGKELLVSPTYYLTRHQEGEMAGQPDLILQLAHHIARDYERRGHGRVEVRAESLVSLNGRPAQLMIDPTRDLVTVADDLAPADWILPAPTSPPIHLREIASR
jgi:vitamin K-dependent gamma-carboxylase